LLGGGTSGKMNNEKWLYSRKITERGVINGRFNSARAKNKKQ
jgi:hypothetical protein